MGINRLSPAPLRRDLLHPGLAVSGNRLDEPAIVAVALFEIADDDLDGEFADLRGGAFIDLRELGFEAHGAVN